MHSEGKVLHPAIYAKGDINRMFIWQGKRLAKLHSVLIWLNKNFKGSQQSISCNYSIYRSKLPPFTKKWQINMEVLFSHHQAASHSLKACSGYWWGHSLLRWFMNTVMELSDSQRNLPFSQSMGRQFLVQNIPHDIMYLSTYFWNLSDLKPFTWKIITTIEISQTQAIKKTISWDLLWTCSSIWPNTEPQEKLQYLSVIQALKQPPYCTQDLSTYKKTCLVVIDE